MNTMMYSPAVDPSEEMLSVLKQTYGPLSPKIAEHLNSLGHYHVRNDAPSPHSAFTYHGDATSPLQSALASALQCHREALQILDWNKCNALLFDRLEESRSYAVDMAITLSDIGNVLRERNNFVDSASAYKECLDLFLEGLVEEGGAIRRRLDKIETDMETLTDHYQNGKFGEYDEYSSYEELYSHLEAEALRDYDLQAIGRKMAHNPCFRLAVRGISNLLREMQYVKFLSQNAASSRRRRRMNQRAKTVMNLKNAVASLTMNGFMNDHGSMGAGSWETEKTSPVSNMGIPTASPTESPMSIDHGKAANTVPITTTASHHANDDEDAVSTSSRSIPSLVQVTRSKSWASTHSKDDEDLKRAYSALTRSSNPPPGTHTSNPCSPKVTRPNILGRKHRTTGHVDSHSAYNALKNEYDDEYHTSGGECVSYASLSQSVIPAERMLTCALNRFPGVMSILDNPPMRATTFTPIVTKSYDEEDNRGSNCESSGYNGFRDYNRDYNRDYSRNTQEVENEIVEKDGDNEVEDPPHLLDAQDDDSVIGDADDDDGQDSRRASDDAMDEQDSDDENDFHDAHYEHGDDSDDGDSDGLVVYEVGDDLNKRDNLDDEDDDLEDTLSRQFQKPHDITSLTNGLANGMKTPPPPQDIVSPRSIKSDIYKQMSTDFVSYSISCGGDLGNGIVGVM